MVKHSSSILKFYSHHKYRITATTVVLYYTAAITQCTSGARASVVVELGCVVAELEQGLS